MTEGSGVSYLRETMAILRGEDGCLWDREQTHDTLIPFLIEEAAELVDAIEEGTRENIVDELGDVLYQVVFHADILADDPHNPVTLDYVARATAEKMRRRHPHVFGDVTVSDVADIRANWVTQKKAEHGQPRPITSQVPTSLHPVARAQSLIHRAARDGIDTGLSAPVQPDEGLGVAMLRLVKAAEDRGLNAETVLREAIRSLEATITAEENRSS